MRESKVTPATTAQKAPVCWVVTDGRAGIVAQALGLAEAVGRLAPLSIEIRKIAVNAPWRYLPRAVWGDPFSKLGGGDKLAPPYPDLWIACGRLSVPFSTAIKKKFPATFVVQLQDPRAPSELFDLVIPPAHDEVSGENVFPIIGAPNRLHPSAAINEENIVAVIIGGPNRAFAFTQEDAQRLTAQLAMLAKDGGHLAITTSRRTPDLIADIFEDRLKGAAKTFYRFGRDDPATNPYPAMIGAARAVIVTEDSVNMAGEAASLGKPLFIAPLARRDFAAARKFDAFHESLRAHGAARVFAGALEEWTYEPLDETARAANEVIRRWRG
ncbi:MAG: mitochondrial fission ELM1 family protein [Parvularculaceae bacterium]